MQKLKELICFLFGHRWSSTFKPNDELSKPIKNRVYCKRCGVRYHKLFYINKN